MLRTRDVRDATDVFVSPWSPRTPVSQRALNDRDLLTYRHPAERRTLVLGIVLLLAIFIGLMFLHELVAKIVLST
jgi:hypothetical protein